VRTLVLTSLTMIAFAANSLLTRGALGHDLIDAPSFTIIRLVAGAVMLAVLLQARRSRRPGPAQSGAWLSALWLAGYAVGFTLAYVVKGERPHVRDWTGLALAMAGLVWLTLPGASAPDLIGAALMIFAGACWGAYSIAGRSSRDPLATTSGNFWRGAIIGAVALGALVAPARITTTGVLLATISGAVTSGLGYAVWYSVIPALGPWRAALVQLTVPILTGLGAVLILGENVSARLAVAAALVTTGVWVSLGKVRGQRKRTN
jgi:drug/metabolite transporter (DMT)-like permease